MNDNATTKCAAMHLPEAAVVMVAERQEELDAAALAAWATERGIGPTLFHGWDMFIEQALFWADIPKPEGASKAVGFIHERLVSVEASPAAVTLWDKLTRQ
jgi:hypothetical protein